MIRTRFAPSPTGFLHIGGLRTALYCYAWAKKNKGKFILRIEDTDQKRLVDNAIEQIISSLAWAGVTPDEGVIVDESGKVSESGKFGPYIQSQRLDLYNKFAQELLSSKKAYKCYCTAERLTEMREVQKAAKQMPKYDRHCYNLSDDKKTKFDQDGQDFVIRFFVEEGSKIEWDDMVFGKMSFERGQVDDFVMIKADGFPTYNFANVVDDHSMEITHVIRGQEFLSSTPKHLLLYKTFDWKVPEMVHVAWILGQNKQKLSKRDNSVAVDDYIKMGILPEALNNYLAMLGWNPGNDREMYSMDDLIKEFDVKDAQKSGAVWDLEKLLWFNAEYIKAMDNEAYFDYVLNYFKDNKVLEGKDVSDDVLKNIFTVEKVRIKTASDLIEELPMYLEDPKVSVEDLIWKKGKKEDLKPVFKAVIAKLEGLKNWEMADIRAALLSITEETDWGVGDVFWPVRVALSGRKQSPGPEEVAFGIGRVGSINRIMVAYNLS